ncbi:hypothetical protein Thermo_00599 [Thermoplasmatales archaeon]|nr:hypothetical protein Thermo_00599 [Thermoplasmatales archaeon]
MVVLGILLRSHRGNMESTEIYPLLPLWTWALTAFIVFVVSIFILVHSRGQDPGWITTKPGKLLAMFEFLLSIVFLVVTYFALTVIGAVLFGIPMVLAMLVGLYNFLTIRSKTKKAGRE